MAKTLEKKEFRLRYRESKFTFLQTFTVIKNIKIRLQNFQSHLADLSEPLKTHKIGGSKPKLDSKWKTFKF